MATTFYDLSVPGFLQTVRAMGGFLERAASHCAATGDDPDAFVSRAVLAGADGSGHAIRDHEAPWGVHRQGGFVDPFGHLWFVGDRSPLRDGAAPSPS